MAALEVSGSIQAECSGLRWLHFLRSFLPCGHLPGPLLALAWLRLHPDIRGLDAHVAGYHADKFPSTMAGDRLIDEAAELVILEPEAWIGKPIPLENYLEPNVNLATGQVISVVYHHDCPDCQKA